MRKLLIAIAITLSPIFALAQMQVGVQRSSSPRGMQVQGDADIKAAAQNVNAVAAGGENAASNPDSAARGGVNIKGNTSINAVAGKQSAVAVGKGNKADNAVGAIGGK